MFTLAPRHAHVPHASLDSRPTNPLRRHALPRVANRRPSSLVPQAIAPEALGRLAVNIITTGLALRTPGLKDLPPSQLVTATAVAAAGTAYAGAGLPDLGMNPTLVAASTYALYRAWRTYDAPPHAVGLRAGTKPEAGHGLLAEFVMLAALADGAGGAFTQAGLGSYALVAAALAPAAWATARTASEDGVAKRYPAARALESIPAKIGLGLLGTLAATFAAERLGGPPAAVAMGLWINAQVFPQDFGA